MDLTVGIEPMRDCLNQMDEKGKWDAWYEHYYLKYQAVFDAMLKFLFRCEVEDLKGKIQQYPFQEALKHGEQFLEDGGVEKVKEMLQEAQDLCSTEPDFDVYLLIGLGTDAMSLPTDEKPFIYLGLDVYGEQLWGEVEYTVERLETLVPHEYCHLVRISSLQLEDPSKFQRLTVKDWMMAEGLATLFPLIMKDQGITPDAVVKSGMMTEEMVSYCKEHEQALFDDIRSDWNRPVNQTLLRKYFVGTKSGWKENGTPERTGYYLGSRIIQDLLEHGQTICDLTKTPTEQLLTWWKEENE